MELEISHLLRSLARSTLLKYRENGGLRKITPNKRQFILIRNLQLVETERRIVVKGNADIDCRLKQWPPQLLSSHNKNHRFSLLRHVVDEMEKSNHSDKVFSRDQFKAADEESRLYDDVWKSEDSDAASLHEFPIDYQDVERSRHDSTVNNAITEVSNDFLSGKIANFGLGNNGDSDESHSDAEFKHVTGMAYVAHYPETAAGMSDNDWNPYCTESDTNITPRVSSHIGSGQSDTKIISLRPSHAGSDSLNTNITPEISETFITRRIPSKGGSCIKSSESKHYSMTSFNPPLHSSDINVNTPSTIMYSIHDPSTHMTSSNKQSGTVVLLKPDITSVTQMIPLTNISDQTTGPCNSLTDCHRGQADLNKTMRVYDLESSVSRSIPWAKGNAEQKENRILKDDNHETPNRLWENKLFLRGTEYIPTTKYEKLRDLSDLIDRNYKQVGRNGHMDKRQDLLLEEESFLNRQFLGQRKENIFLSTQNPGKSDTKKKTHVNTIVDYSSLQQDLQDIQDGLKLSRDAKEVKLYITGQSKKTISHSSDSDCDIIPSTTTTPEKYKNKMSWDFASDLGYQQPGDLMGDISMETLITKSHMSSDEKKSYNSDGEETITSASSDKVLDHVAADQALAEMSQILHPQTNNHRLIRDADQVLLNFRNQKQQIESRYKNMDTQSLAEKVCRILTNPNTSSQAKGMPLGVKNEKIQAPVNLQKKDFSVSLDESNQSLARPDSVRKRLDLSGLSSLDVSKLTEKSIYIPTGKGLTASDGMTKLLSSQLAKALERTFNHSIDMVVPQQVIQCYPLTIDNKLEEKKGDESRNEAHQTESGARRFEDVRQVEESGEEKKDISSNLDTGNIRPNSTMGPFTGLGDPNQSSAPSHDDSDSSSGRRREKYRPYRPAGSKEVYYTESDGASLADSVTTMESTHIGSDDARGPVLPPSAMGSRQNVPNVAGIYGNKTPQFSQDGDNLPPIQEKPGLDERETESNHSTKEDKISENLRSRGKGHNGSSLGTESNAVVQQEDSSSQSQGTTLAESSKIEEEKSLQSTEVTNPADETNNIARWAYLKTQLESNAQEPVRVNENSNVNHNTRVKNFEQLTGGDHLHHQTQFEEEHQRHNNCYSRNQAMQDNDPSELRNDNKYGSIGDFSNRSESIMSRRNSDRFFRNRFNDAEKPFSPQDHHSLPRERLSEERFGTLYHSHSEENLFVRDVRLSPSFHHALSPELRQAIERRSPILSHHIERSLRQPPIEWPDPHGEKDQEREYMNNQRHSSASARYHDNRSWSPALQTRVVSPFQDQEDMEQPKQSLYSTESQGMTLREESPDVDERNFHQSSGSMRTQLLTQALVQENQPDIHPNIGALWEQFKANNESSESSLNTSKLEDVSDLLLNPSPHLVAQCLKEREEHIIHRQEQAETEREKRRTQQWLERRQVLHSSSEDSINASYTELLAQKEEERMKRRTIRKKKGKTTDAYRKVETISDSVPENLFSIPEDTSFEQSPHKFSSPPKHQKSKKSRQANIIDPNMEKLRDRISKQRQKIDKHALQELQRIEKLKKLEQLLVTKRKGEISDQTFEQQLEEISSTSTPASDTSQGDYSKHARSLNTTPLSDDSTTAKDSSAEMHAWKTNKEIRMKELKVKEAEKIDKLRATETENSSTLTRRSHGRNKKRSDLNFSERELLKLVKDGFMTADEAYRLALMKEAAASDISSYGGSTDEFYNSHSTRLHRLYSPYYRDEGHHVRKPHYISKVKSPPFVYKVGGAPNYRPWYKQANKRSISGETDFNVSHDPFTENKQTHPRITELAKSSKTFRERPVLSVPIISIPGKGHSPHRLLGPRGTSSPGRYETRVSPSRLSTTRHEQNSSPVRAHSTSPRSRNDKKYRHLSKHMTSGPVWFENAFRSENEPPLGKKTPERGVAWHIPMDQNHSSWKIPDMKTNRQLPLQERKIVSNRLPMKTDKNLWQIENVEPLQGWQKEENQDVWHKPDHPQGIPAEMWQHIVRNDALANKTNHWEVDPLMDRVQYILSKCSVDSATEDERLNSNEKPVSKMSLQEAFMARKQGFISKCKERQKRLALACEHRKMQECLRLEREVLFMNQEKAMTSNLNAHPYSDNLFQPKRRFLSKQQMRELTMKRYKKLPEVLKKTETDKKRDQCRLNRLRVSIFNRKVQRELLRKKPMRLR